MPVAALPAQHAAAAPILQVASWNLQSCRRGIPGIVKALKSLDADVVAFQEVDRGTRRSGQLDQVAVLAKEAGFPFFHFFPALDWDIGEYGLALASRHPIVDPRVVHLPVTANIEPRILASAVVLLPTGPLSVNVTHLSHRVSEGKLRVEQVRRIQEVLARDPLPKVLIGDFNDTPGSGMHEAMAGAFEDAFEKAGEGSSGTFPLPLPFSPAVRIDYVWTSKELRAAKASVVETEASDHYILTAKIVLPAATLEAPRATANGR